MLCVHVALCAHALVLCLACVRPCACADVCACLRLKSGILVPCANPTLTQRRLQLPHSGVWRKCWSLFPEGRAQGTSTCPKGLDAVLKRSVLGTRKGDVLTLFILLAWSWGYHVYYGCLDCGRSEAQQEKIWKSYVKKKVVVKGGNYVEFYIMFAIQL